MFHTDVDLPQQTPLNQNHTLSMWLLFKDHLLSFITISLKKKKQIKKRIMDSLSTYSSHTLGHLLLTCGIKSQGRDYTCHFVMCFLRSLYWLWHPLGSTDQKWGPHHESEPFTLVTLCTTWTVVNHICKTLRLVVFMDCSFHRNI